MLLRLSEDQVLTNGIMEEARQETHKRIVLILQDGHIEKVFK
jgi:hypothetical protein